MFGFIQHNYELFNAVKVNYSEKIIILNSRRKKPTRLRDLVQPLNTIYIMNTKTIFLKTLMVVIVLWFTQTFLFANNLQITNVRLVGRNVVNDFTMVQFDISWENSWRTSTLESNWDAAWIFVKFRRTGDTFWGHCFLNNTGHNAPAGSTIAPGFVNTGIAFDPITNPAVGVFLHRSTDGIGNVNYVNVQLRWNYGVNGLADYDSVEVCVFAIEMVHIPQGSFYVGDNDLLGTSTSSGRFIQGTGTLPFRITSEAALTIGNTATNELWGTSTTGANSIGGAGTLAASFPKGFAGFYIMKHELSQQMYKEFLNRLTRTQQAARVWATATGMFMGDNTTNTTPRNRNGIRVMFDPGGTLPRVYGNDLNNNGIEGEANDGQHIACNWISAHDLGAFADWAGLRPFTELEFEKASRGILDPVANEMAWGNTGQTNTTGITNGGQANELASNPGANVVSGNQAGVQGPMRVGNFARAATNRVQAGAGYFGVLEMSGNVSEYVVSVGIPAHRTFDGSTHGNGSITTSGAADITGWPETLGMRGGSWAEIASHLFVSDRSQAINPFTAGRHSFIGGRLGRTN